MAEIAKQEKAKEKERAEILRKQEEKKQKEEGRLVY